MSANTDHHQSATASTKIWSERGSFVYSDSKAISIAFAAISFDPAKHPNEAGLMIDTFQQSIYRKYSGDLYSVKPRCSK